MSAITPDINMLGSTNKINILDPGDIISVLEVLNNQRDNWILNDSTDKLDIETIFEEINSLTDKSDNRSVDEIIEEAESLIRKDIYFGEKGNEMGLYSALQVEQQVSEEPFISDCPLGTHKDKIEQLNDCNKIENTIDDLSHALDNIDLLYMNTSYLSNEEPNTNAQRGVGNKLLDSKVLSTKHDQKTNQPRKSVSDSTQPLANLSYNRVPIKYVRNVCDNEQSDDSKLTTDDDFASNKKEFLQETFSDNGIKLSPKQFVSAASSPIEGVSFTREHSLKQEIELLQEKLKDTEERLQSLRIQHDSLSQLHRDLRESNTYLQDQSELLKLDVQHLNECANILRAELQSARIDRNAALEIQRDLQSELQEVIHDKKIVLENNETDSKIIKDLQRQCREMERILIRKHPDSVSALIVAAKNPSKLSDGTANSRNLLEQRIAQLESDAKDQDVKAQRILANVQTRFNSVQSKYETHIADLETQVLSLQEINCKLNSKIENQIHTIDFLITKRASNLENNSTQTEEIPEREIRQVAIATQTDTSTNYNTNQSNKYIPKQGSIKKSALGKVPCSHSDSTISVCHSSAKEDAHLLATIRGMRIDLAIKDKAMQRLTRELDECRKTIKKLQKERDGLKWDKPVLTVSSSGSRRPYHSSQYTNHADENQALKEALNKIKLLEFDYKSLNDKRLQDLKTLQTAHERELNSCQETARILQLRLTERDEAFAMHKRRKVPIDYYALKAKVSSLERRHSEREDRLHMLVDALSNGRLNCTLEDILNSDNSK